MKDTNFIVVQHWMVSKLELSGNELLVFALIHGFSQDNESSFFGSAQYIADSIGTSRRSIMDILSRLVAKNYLEKNDTTVNGVRMCSYKSCSNLIGYEESSHGDMKNLHRVGCEESSHNNIPSHTKEHKKEKVGLFLSFPEGMPENYKNEMLIFIDSRKEIKKPMTQRALDIILKKLEPFTPEERTTAINNSITSLWSDVYPQKKKDKYGKPIPEPLPVTSVSPRPTHCDRCGKPMATNHCSCGRQLFCSNGVYAFEEGAQGEMADAMRGRR